MGGAKCISEKRSVQRSAMVGAAEEFITQCGIDIHVKEKEAEATPVDLVIEGKVKGLFELFDERMISSVGMGGVICYTCERVMCIAKDEFEQVCEEMKEPEPVGP